MSTAGENLLAADNQQENFPEQKEIERAIDRLASAYAETAYVGANEGVRQACLSNIAALARQYGNKVLTIAEGYWKKSKHYGYMSRNTWENMCLEVDRTVEENSGK